MAVVVVKDLINEEELDLAKEEYGSYVKMVVDINQGFLAAGGEWHADAERVLLESGSEQKDLWGGGLDLETGQVDYISLINTRPSFNNSHEVADTLVRERMFEIIKKRFDKYVKNR